MFFETWQFIFFNLLVLGLLALDLFVFHRKPHEVTLKEAGLFSIFWIALGLAFAGVVFLVRGWTSGIEFLTGYLVEKSLSVDNLFVFIVIFTYFGIPPKYQHRVLFWGVVGALITRSIFIGVGVALIAHFHWILDVFAVLLLYSGIKLFFERGVSVHPERNAVIRFTRKVYPYITESVDSPAFFVKRGRAIFLTPLFLVLLTIETTDIMFAVDSLPAVFGVTQDAFIVYSSNVFAILGLRALYFLLSGAMQRNEHLSRSLAFVLIFIGIKMIIAPWYPIPTEISLIVVAGMISAAFLLSWLQRQGNGRLYNRLLGRFRLPRQHRAQDKKI
ncbi:MAG TPA: TerC family protein [Bacteroidota bacterium]|nr:TerC family protein [Bacteroidota bacterium]